MENIHLVKVCWLASLYSEPITYGILVVIIASIRISFILNPVLFINIITMFLVTILLYAIPIKGIITSIIAVVSYKYLPSGKYIKGMVIGTIYFICLLTLSIMTTIYNIVYIPDIYLGLTFTLDLAFMTIHGIFIFGYFFGKLLNTKLEIETI
ncbi:MAG: hypothetical protein ACP6IU_00685 [Candidatus Asgardarchaeia archaeon]